MMKNAIYIIGMICCLVALPAWSQSVVTADTLPESKYELQQVYVYGKSKTQQLKESAWTVSALDIKPLVNSLNNLNRLVDRTSGVKVREEGGVGSDFDLSINGLSGN